MQTYDVPEVIRPVYHTASGQLIPRPISGIGADAAQTADTSTPIRSILKWAVIIGGVYMLRKPIGMWLAGFDPDSKIQHRVVSGAKGAASATARAAKKYAASRR